VVTLNRYLLAGLITLAILGVVFGAVLLLDDWRVSGINKDLEDLSIQSESNRVLFFYNQVFDPAENPRFCELANSSATLRSNQGDLLFAKLENYEGASFFGSYRILRQKYLLNRIELWLFTTLQNKTCGSNFVPVLFFYESTVDCPECLVQGNILEELRNQCPNVKIFALSVDEEIDLVPLIQSQFNVSTVPSLVVDNQFVFESLTTKEEILRNIKCEEVIAKRIVV